MIKLLGGLVLIFTALILPMETLHAEEEVIPVEVKVRAWLGESTDTADKLWTPTEQIILQIEVSTNRWFTSGTKITGIEIPNVLVKQRNTFAVNYTEQENGQTWSRQHWEITLYPQTSGDFTVPEGKVITQVADDHGHKKSVTLTTPTIPFHVALPSAELAATKSWFAASDVNVQQEWNINEKDMPKAGDSVTRTIKIEVKDSLSVLLPNLMKPEPSSMWKVYSSSPELQDKQNRLSYVSTRIDKQTYVLQNGGEAHWPELQLWWWNTEKGQLEKITLAGKTLQVKHTLSSWLTYYGWELVTALFSVCGLVLLLVWLRNYYQTHPLPLWLKFYHALRRGQWVTCRQLLYRRLRVRKQLLAMTAASNEPNWQHAAQNVQSTTATRADFTYLWKRIKTARASISLPKALVELERSKSLPSK